MKYARGPKLKLPQGLILSQRPCQQYCNTLQYLVNSVTVHAIIHTAIVDYPITWVGHTVIVEL